MTESNLPPDVTPEMIDAQCIEEFFCEECSNDVTDDPKETGCPVCRVPLCPECLPDHMRQHVK